MLMRVNGVIVAESSKAVDFLPHALVGSPLEYLSVCSYAFAMTPIFADTLLVVDKFDVCPRETL